MKTTSAHPSLAGIPLPWHQVLELPHREAVLLPDTRVWEQAATLGTNLHSLGFKPLELRRCPALDTLADDTGATRIWLGLEHLQITGSFKVRGATLAMLRLKKRGIDRVVTASAGNHAAGVAFAANALGTYATVVVPESTPSTKLARLQSDRVTVHVTPGGYDAAEQVARQLAHRDRIPFLSPYADDDIAAGNGTSLAAELVSALGHCPDHVVVPIGGGGLASGIGWGLPYACPGLRSRRVWCVQSEASPAFALSCRDGKAWTHLASLRPTVAEGLEGGIEQRAFERAAKLVTGVSVIPEAWVRDAMRWSTRQLAGPVEGSAAVVIALARHGLPKSTRGGDVVLLLTGRNVDP